MDQPQLPTPQKKGIGQIGDYYLLGQLEKGTQATVFTGEDKSGKQFAIKIFNRTKDYE